MVGKWEPKNRNLVEGGVSNMNLGGNEANFQLNNIDQDESTTGANKMQKETIDKLNKTFEEYAYEQDGIDYWLARELQTLLGYTEWRNFLNAIDKAKESCKITNEAVLDHFVDINKMV